VPSDLRPGQSPHPKSMVGRSMLCHLYGFVDQVFAREKQIYVHAKSAHRTDNNITAGIGQFANTIGKILLSQKGGAEKKLGIGSNVVNQL
jgi:hypothetical protein